MVDEPPFYSPQAKPLPPRKRTPGEPLWSLGKNGRQVDCELRFHGESYGWEAQFFHEGELACGRRFLLKAGALEEAEVQRLIGEGWQQT